MKIAVVGSRNFPSKSAFRKAMYRHVNPMRDIIVSGGAEGPDTWAQQWAKHNAAVIEIHYPNWKDFGKKAGLIRNRAIEDSSYMCLAFWDGESKGTKSTIDLFEKAGKKVVVINA